MEISGTTRLICLLGDPVAHSVSPAMHNLAFKTLELDYCYMAFRADENTLPETVEALKALDVRGWNLTMPCKTKMCELVDELSPAAKLTHSVNTVVNDKGRLTGHTTDGSGYMQMLAEAGVEIIGKKMVIAGAGGAARAIAVQAALDGVAEIAIFNRSIEKASHLADDINKGTKCYASAYDIKDTSMLKQELEDAVLFTNATQVGMAPNQHTSIVEETFIFPENLIVSDIVYNPRKTQLLVQAESQGLKTIGGLKMLLWQGAHAFKLWTGQSMPVDVVAARYFAD